MYLFGANYYTQTIAAPEDEFPAQAATTFFKTFRFGGGPDMTKTEKKSGPPAVKSKPPGPDR